MNSMTTIEEKPDTLIINLFSLYIILKPFYLWQSGLPQVSDVILMLTFVLLMFRKKQTFGFHSRYGKLIFINLLFVNYIFLVNVVWSYILDGGLPAIRISSYYLFNFVAFLFILQLNSDPGHYLQTILFKAVLFSVVLQTGFFFIAGGFSGGRVTAFFNNPNQLGYHSLVCAALLLYCSEKAKAGHTRLFIGLFCTGLLVMASLSKAAIIAYIVMMVYYIVFYKKRTKVETGWIILFIAMLLLLLTLLVIDKAILMSNPLLNAVFNRISMIGADSDDSLAGRGYTRLLDYGAQLFFGIGEGGYFRFDPPGEFHSTLGNLLLSYGIIGLLFFVYIVLMILKSNRFKDTYLIISILLYGVTHNGIRNTLFWILMGLMFSTGMMEKELKENQEDQGNKASLLKRGGV